MDKRKGKERNIELTKEGRKEKGRKGRGKRIWERKGKERKGRKGKGKEVGIVWKNKKNKIRNRKKRNKNSKKAKKGKVRERGKGRNEGRKGKGRKNKEKRKGKSPLQLLKKCLICLIVCILSMSVLPGCSKHSIDHWILWVFSTHQKHILWKWNKETFGVIKSG